MFFSHVSIAEKYNYLEEKFTVAYKWLAETNIKDLPEGSYPLMGDEVVAGVQEYTTSPWEERRFETHDKYFDIQFMVTGNEMFGVCKRDGLKEINRIEENDVVFYEGLRKAISLSLLPKMPISLAARQERLLRSRR